MKQTHSWEITDAFWEAALEQVLRGFIPHIRSRGGEKTDRKLVRFEKLTASYPGLLMFACAFIAFRKADVI